MEKAINIMSDLFGVTPRILIVLKNFSDGATITELQDKSRVSSTALYNALRKLLEYQIIVEVREPYFPKRRLIKLTEKGKNIAEYLAKIEEALSS